MDTVTTFEPATISEPACLLFRRGSMLVGLQRTLRLTIIFSVVLLAFEAVSLRYDANSGRLPALLFLLAPFAGVLIASLPRTIHLTADSIAITKHFDKREYSVTGDNKPILLVRPIAGRKHHLALISPTVSDRLFEIAPVFECVVADEDVPKIRFWCDFDPDGESGEPSDAPKDRESRIDNGNHNAGPR